MKDLDKYDMILQAFEYEVKENKPGWLEEFFVSTEGKFTHPRVVNWAQELYQQRRDFINTCSENIDAGQNVEDKSVATETNRADSTS